MTAHSRLPGELLLRIAAHCFDEPALSAIIQPAVADYQREVFKANGHGLAVRIRGTAALAKVLFLAALLPGAGAGAPLTRTLLGLNGASSLALLAPIFYLGVSPMFGPFIAGAVVAGMALAVGLNSWNSHHPTAVACTRRIYSRDPEINISSVPVGGNIGGLFFVAASTLTILLGLPELRWFVVAAMVAGAAMAWGLVAWHRAHSNSPTRRIVVH